jgi:uncharacterized phiE125 gp8 family phage protein
MTLIRTVEPAVEPLSLAEAKAHLRLSGDGEDETVLALIRAARQEVERQSGQALIDQHWRLVLDDWPADDFVLIRRGPVREILAVTVFGEDGAATLMPAPVFLADTVSEPARIVFRERPRPGVPLNGIEIDFRCGHGASGADVPDLMKRAILLLVAHWYEFRGVVEPSGQPVGYPSGFDRLLASFRPARLA